MNEKASKLYRRVAKIAGKLADPVDAVSAERSKYKELKLADGMLRSGSQRAQFRAGAREWIKLYEQSV